MFLAVVSNNLFSRDFEKTAERRAVSADSNRQKSENKEYLPDWLEPKQTDKNSDYTQERHTEELFNRHRRSSSDKIIQEVSSNYFDAVKMILPEIIGRHRQQTHNERMSRE